VAHLRRTVCWIRCRVSAGRRVGRAGAARAAGQLRAGEARQLHGVLAAAETELARHGRGGFAARAAKAG
jgi:hypothetical protein